MHLSKGEIEIHSVLPGIAFLPFSQNKRRQPNHGELAYADHCDKFFMSMFHLKADKKEKRKVVIKQKMESTE